ncbi:MAG: hypothetical protein R6U43_08205 [Candidatus Krumholzibacteriales bacterium]
MASTPGGSGRRRHESGGLSGGKGQGTGGPAEERIRREVLNGNRASIDSTGASGDDFMPKPSQIKAGEKLLQYLRARKGVLTIGDFYVMHG